MATGLITAKGDEWSDEAAGKPLKDSSQLSENFLNLKNFGVPIADSQQPLI